MRGPPTECTVCLWQLGGNHKLVPDAFPESLRARQTVWLWRGWRDGQAVAVLGLAVLHAFLWAGEVCPGSSRGPACGQRG